mmetsp:Transcript_55637/g.82390  ORF Transcript_55637/g.82390 Transcript_55637/m.82390 type:complete len:91 (+) Transcript_55637:72-344(+)|eukprot:CAMPEP_0195518888 /NCGR_PEP_ID=MMETSP0794_2-20130614/13869_1 /TAXON_ID=515487 /ORGANISM="Stephanopyxis turris, Strain CCMP 815" /LENGTH=90 /DNA_ID=CAMNT_0040647925 /DNA_START=71 /DNA_END=343 /DNA_ORIENTATION=-
MPINAASIARHLSERGDPEFTDDSYLVGAPAHRLSKDECEILSKAFGGEISKLPVECKSHVGVSRKIDMGELKKRETAYQVWKEGAEEPI